MIFESTILFMYFKMITCKLFGLVGAELTVLDQLLYCMFGVPRVHAHISDEYFHGRRKSGESNDCDWMDSHKKGIYENERHIIVIKLLYNGVPIWFTGSLRSYHIVFLNYDLEKAHTPKNQARDELLKYIFLKICRRTTSKRCPYECLNRKAMITVTFTVRCCLQKSSGSMWIRENHCL